ncbi:hypothetical protein FJSC11DRAFT_0172 [Fischerella thermalis JSC-11]|jgi:hypothetical protein|uniref:Uncharacterized protein n=1 Tax=Fischerella thermalis JSC-11 TaxID=741277 RepID=G6FMS5_9CYAN|nr:hypothetical protein FJSC11DRAFT_0172 [Fischerella thermalis JSC-11]
MICNYGDFIFIYSRNFNLNYITIEDSIAKVTAYLEQRNYIPAKPLLEYSI